jgi:hypothetical protein
MASQSPATRKNGSIKLELSDCGPDFEDYFPADHEAQAIRRRR